jgi:anti-sigma factor RsiW
MNEQMPCEQIDLKAYALGEASVGERKVVEGHAATCGDCRAELETLGTLQIAMRSWTDEEPPRRIAFVSDKVFEPRWWQRINWAQMLVPAALSALAAFAVVRTQAPAPQAVAVDTVSANIDGIVAERVSAAVKQVLAESEARQQAQAAQLVRATERRMRLESKQAMAQTLAMVDANFEYMRKREARVMRASADLGGLR